MRAAFAFCSLSCANPPTMQHVPFKSLDKLAEVHPRHDGVALDIDELLSFQELDDLVGLAKSIYGVGAAFVTILGRQYQWFLAESGLDIRMSPIEGSICRRIVHERGECFIGDTRLDADLADNPFVTGEHAVRFYAGVPIQAVRPDNGETISGTFCIADSRPREAANFDAAKLKMLATFAHSIIELRISRAIATEAIERQAAMLEKLDRNEKLFARVERMADMGSWRFDLVTGKHAWSDGIYAIHGLEPVAVPPAHEGMKFYPPHARKQAMAAWEGAVRHGEPLDLELDFLTASGSKKRIRVMGEVEYKDARPVALIGLMKDVTAQHAMQKALRREAMTDALTGLPNRAGFHMHIAERMGAAKRAREIALLVVDLDGFKLINDQIGHLAGDRALTKCGLILRKIVEGTGFAARYGGDEFVIVLSGEDICGHSRQIAHDITQALRFEIDPGDPAHARLMLGATVGIAYNRDGDAVHDIIHRADIAMYEAKRADPGTVNVASAKKVA